LNKIIHLMTAGLLIIPLSESIAQQQAQASIQEWTLESSIQQALCISPELKKSLEEINLRQVDASLSSMWPDPSIELRVDNKLGQDDNSGGYDLTDITISQEIPLSRIKYQQSVSEANLSAAGLENTHQLLLLQKQISRSFHELQLASAKLDRAEKQRQLATQLSQSKSANTPQKTAGEMVRYLTPLEKIRIDIIREEAYQQERNAEGKYNEVLTRFSKLVGVAPENIKSVAKLKPISGIPQLESLLEAQQRHAYLSSQQQVLLAAKHEVDLARNTLVSDPTISLSRSRDTFDSGRDDVYGVMVNIEIPIHDRKDAKVSKAKYKASQENIELQRLRRELQINLKSSYTHLQHVYEQAEDYHGKVIKPARKILDLTQRGFNSGELKMLDLIDAHKTYFGAQLQYLELLYDARVELADVIYYSGQQLSGVDYQLSCSGQEQ